MGLKDDFMTVTSSLSHPRQASVRDTLLDAWRTRRVWWFTATARTKARFVRTSLGSFWLGLSNLFSIAVLAAVYGTVFKVQNFSVYVVYLGVGLVVWNSISAAVGGAPNLFEHNRDHLHNINLHPVFYTLEEWAFQLQTFVQSFLLVVVAFIACCCCCLFLLRAIFYFVTTHSTYYNNTIHHYDNEKKKKRPMMGGY